MKTTRSGWRFAALGAFSVYGALTAACSSRSSATAHVPAGARADRLRRGLLAGLTYAFSAYRFQHLVHIQSLST